MTRAWWSISFVGLLGVAACGGSDDTDLFQGSGGKAGAAGKAGATAAGSGGSSTAGSGGSSTAGSGGSSTGGKAGAGGASACAGGCDDGVPCTIDSCVDGACVHVPGSCPAAQHCDVKAGCTQSPACADDAACKALWAADPCKTNVRCDGATATCKFDLLDKDGDLHWPVVCGGDDCDDVNPSKHPGRAEVCDGQDNDCDGAVDGSNLCAAPRVCAEGACSCPADNKCGSECVDKSTSPNHCGACGKKCPAGATCVNGACDCPGDAVACGASCVDTQASQQHCGACDKPCTAQQKCVSGACQCLKKSCGGACVDPDTDPKNCGDCGVGCAAGAACSAGVCLCPAAKPDTCLGACVDKQTDPKHCGDCGVDCGGNACVGGQCSTCTPGALLVLVDTSGSMSSPLGGTTRLKEATTAVKNVIQEAASSGVSVGLQLYPRYDSSAGSTCLAADYAALDVALAALPANAPALTAALDGAKLTGVSLIGAPLVAGVDTLRAWASAHPGAPLAIAIINDGATGLYCSGEVPDAIAAATAGVAGTPSVKTYVIGLGSPTVEELQVWTDVATAGGGTASNTSIAGDAAIADALRAARATVACP